MERVEEAVNNVLSCLSHVGYISHLQEYEYKNRLKEGDETVYRDTKELLVKLFLDLGKKK